MLVLPMGLAVPEVLESGEYMRELPTRDRLGDLEMSTTSAF
jgi:hypothetical protein